MTRAQRLGVVAVAAVTAFFLGSIPRVQGAAPQKWVSGFYVGYMSQPYPPNAIDYSALSHVIVFSVLPKADGQLDTSLFVDPVRGPEIAKDVAKRAHAAGKKAILAVGGDGTAAGFRVATTPDRIAGFVQNLLRLATTWGFDGLDIDWEPLPASDYPTVLAVLKGIRATRPEMLLTADLGWQGRPLNAEDNDFYRQMAPLVDQMNMMTYSMSDNWGGWVVWHSSPIFGEGPDHPTSVDSSVSRYLNAGVPASKLGVGIGFYGTCWNAPAMMPLQQPGASHVVASDNDMSFTNIKNLYYRQGNAHFDRNARASYLSFLVPTGPRNCTFISYEDETSVAAKGLYIYQRGLGGAMIWHLNEGYNPKAPDPNGLLHAVARALR